MQNFKATLFHDQGKVTISLSASNKKSAINQIMKAENCPQSAIKSMVRLVKRGKQLEAIPVKL